MHFCRFIAILGVALAGFGAKVCAGPLDVDPTFVPGQVLGVFGTGNSDFSKLLMLPDGRVIAAGLRELNSSYNSMCLACYLPDGRLDTSFGEMGLVDGGYTPIGEPCIARQPSGRLLAASIDPSSQMLYITGLNSQGQRDATFGAGGGVAIAGTGLQSCIDIAVDSSGRILITGDPLTGSTSWFSVVRLMPDGGLDASFGTDGVATMPMPYVTKGWVVAVRALEDGRVLVGGASELGNGAVDHTLVMYLDNGLPDPSFGPDGAVVSDLGGHDACHDMEVLSSGEILCAGHAGGTTTGRPCLARFTANGQLDASFGGGGVVITTTDGFGFHERLELMPDGGIAVKGLRYGSENWRFRHVVSVFETDGSPSQTFNAEGLADAQVDGPLARAVGPVPSWRRQDDDIVVTPDGRIRCLAAFAAGDITMMRILAFLSDGIRDGSFGGGVTIPPVPAPEPYGSTSTEYSVTMLDDGGMLLCTGRQDNGVASVWVARLNANGSLRSSFGTQGLMQLPFPASYVGRVARSVMQPDGKIVVLGSDGYRFQLWRLLPDGQPDVSFGTGGRAYSTGMWGYPTAFRVLLMADGRILCVGDSMGANPTSNYLVSARFLSNGAVDASYGVNGALETFIGRLSVYCQDVQEQADGKIVLCGYVSDYMQGAETDVLLARFNTDGSFDSTFGSGGMVIEDWGGRGERGRKVRIRQDGRILVMTTTLVVYPYPVITQAVQYLANGARDSSFGSGGVAQLSGVACNGAALQADGKFLIAGYRPEYPSYKPQPLFLTRLGADGSLDTGFGEDGTFYTSMSPVRTVGYEIATAADGRITLVASATCTALGFGITPNKFRTVIFRFEGGPLYYEVTTLPVTSLGQTQAMLNGTVLPLGGAGTVSFEYGIGALFDSSVPVALPSGSAGALTPVSTTLTGLLPGTTYQFRLVSQNRSGNRTGSTGSFTTLTPQGAWRLANFGTAANTGSAADQADFDGDGLANFLEWACGRDPTLAGASLTQASVNAGALEFRYPRNITAAAAGTLFVVEWSDSLASGSWSSQGVTEVVESNDGFNQQICAKVPMSTSSGRFARLRIQGPP